METKPVRKLGARLVSACLLLAMLATLLTLQVSAAGSRTVEKNANGEWVCTKNGAIETSYTGIAGNKYGWWRIVDGYVDFEANGVFKNEYGWWYVVHGKVNFGYTGLATNVYGTWYVKNGKVDFSKNGTYEKGGVTYDLSGGKAAGNGKAIYLTFDDGPAAYTDQLLNILDKYGIKVTFFVTNCYPSYQYDIAKEYKAGHQVAVHTYTHSYGTIYRSTSAYWNDFEKMQQVLVKQTGQRTSMFRFPGGSSNTVSRRYCRGVMTSLSQQAGQKGLTYYDWNVDADDAGKTRTSDGVYSNITRGVQRYRQSIVLCHDVKSYTVNAMDRTIKWCLQNGYTFRVLQPGGFAAHLKVAN